MKRGINLSHVSEWIKKYQDDIILFVGVVLISLLSFAFGFITASERQKEGLDFQIYEENESSHIRGRDMRIVSGLEDFSAGA